MKLQGVRQAYMFSIGLLLLGVPTVMAQGFVEEVTSDEPLSWWRFEEGDAFEAEDSGTTAETIAEYEFDIEFDQPGLIATEPDSKAIRVGADVDPHAGVHLLDSFDLNTGGPYDQKSIVLWFQADDVDTVDEQVLFEEGGTTRGINLYVREGNLYMGAWNRADDDGGLTSPWLAEDGGDDDDLATIFLSTPISSGETYQAALVMDGDIEGVEGELRGYLNGQLFDAATGVGQMFNHGDNGAIGHKHQNSWFDLGTTTGDGNPFTGVIDEVAFYNEVLPEERIVAQYTAGSGNAVGGTPGDFNGDGLIDAADIDALSEEVRNMTNNAAFDLTGDGIVDQADRTFWVNDIRNTWLGDSNLDGEFSSADFVQVFQQGEYQDQQAGNSTWIDGDWNGDAEFDSSDFVTAFQAGGFEMGPRAAVNAVPEPAASLLTLIGGLLLSAIGRRSRQ